MNSTYILLDTVLIPNTPTVNMSSRKAEYPSPNKPHLSFERLSLPYGNALTPKFRSRVSILSLKFRKTRTLDSISLPSVHIVSLLAILETEMVI